MIWQFLLYWTGGTNGSGAVYLEWSGFISNLGIFTAIVVWYKHHKCKSCWRIAHHSVAGTHYKTCHKHATIDDHHKLQMRHWEHHPKQHEFLKLMGE